jgi:hypothetical protein
MLLITVLHAQEQKHEPAAAMPEPPPQQHGSMNLTTDKAASYQAQ